MLENVPVGINREFEFVVFDWTPDRLAIKAHEDSRDLAQIKSRWIGLDAADVLRINGAFIQVGQHSIEGDDAILVGNILLNLFYDFLSLLLRQTLEIGFRDLESGKFNQSLLSGDERVSLDFDCSHYRFL